MQAERRSGGGGGTCNFLGKVTRFCIRCQVPDKCLDSEIESQFVLYIIHTVKYTQAKKFNVSELLTQSDTKKRVHQKQKQKPRNKIK